MADKPVFETYEVIGDLPIIDAESKAEVRKGGLVKLDPAKTLIQPLLDGGSIKALPAKVKAEA